MQLRSLPLLQPVCKLERSRSSLERAILVCRGDERMIPLSSPKIRHSQPIIATLAMVATTLMHSV